MIIFPKQRLYDYVGIELRRDNCLGLMARPSKPLASVKQTKYSVAIAKTTFAGISIPASSVSALFRHRTPMETSHNAVKNKVGSLCRLVLKGCTYFKGTNFKIMNIEIIMVFANWLTSKMYRYTATIFQATGKPT